MIYNNDIKKWEHAGGAQGMSRVHVYFNPGSDSYRIVGRKVNDNEVSVLSVYVKSIKILLVSLLPHFNDHLTFSLPDKFLVFSRVKNFTS